MTISCDNCDKEFKTEDKLGKHLKKCKVEKEEPEVTVETICADNNVGMIDDKISLKDFAKNIIQSKNPQDYVKKVPSAMKEKIEKDYYITQDNFMKLLEKNNTQKCKEICKSLKGDKKKDDVNVKTLINVSNNKFIYQNNELDIIKSTENIWFRAKQISDILGLGNCRDAVGRHVDDDDKNTYENLVLSKCRENRHSKSTNSQSIYINESGLYSLILSSKIPSARKFKQWVTKEVLPSLRKYGSYSMDPLGYRSVYTEKNISDFDKKNVVYLAYVGNYNDEDIFKYGISRRVFGREYKEHRKNFDKFEMVYIEECDNNMDVEDSFENEMKVRNMHRTITIGKKTQTELFAVSTDYDIVTIKSLLDGLIKSKPLPALEHANTKIKMLQDDKEVKKLELKLKLRQEKTKMKELEIKEEEIKLRLREKEIELEKKKIEYKLMKAKKKK